MVSIRRALSATAALGLLLVACTSGELPLPAPDAGEVAEVPETNQPADDPRRGGTLRVGLSTDPASLDPRFIVDDAGELIVDALFDPLVRVEADGEVVPAAAARWDVGADGREFTFELRPATFHDGTPVTAADFVRTFNRIADGTAEPVSFLAYLLGAVEGAEASQTTGVALSGVEAVDERTLRLRLTEPDPGFLVTLSDPSLVPLPASADENLPAFGDQPIGNGPFAMSGPREQGSFVRLSRFVDHRTPPLLDEVVFTVYSDARGQDQQWTDILNGQLQVADLSPANRQEAIERFGISSDGYRGPGVLQGITSTVYLYGVDTTEAPYDDSRVRRALSLAIDREALANEVMQGTRAPATSIVPPSLPGGGLEACDACRHDPQRAADLLAEVRADALAAAEKAATAEDADPSTEGEAGPVEAVVDVPVLERVTLTHTRGDTHAAIAERMAADISEALDIEVDFQARDLQAFIQSVRAGEVPVFRLGWEVSTPDVGAFLRPLFHSSQVGGDNLTGYANAEVDALLDEARAISGPRARRGAFRAAERRILEDLPALPLLWYRHNTVVADDVEELVYSSLRRMNLEEVWLEQEEP